MGGIRNVYEMLVRKGVWEGTDSGVLGMDGDIILKLILDWWGETTAYIWHKPGSSDWLL